MTFTTPDTASEPYWADAPPVTVSTRSTISVGIRLRSTVTGTPSLLAGDDGTMRLPFTNTSVRCPPRERRSAVAWAGLPVLVALAPGLRVGLKAGLRFSRSEEHTSELQSLMRISYAVFCLKKKKDK